MLGKLVKYDMKALNRFLIIIHAFLLLAAVCGRFFITNRIILSNDSDSVFGMNQFLLSLAILLFVVVICAASFGTIIVIAVRYYKNLYSDEGYLSYTLPVSKGTHLLSKTISGTIWCLIDSLLLFFTLWIVVFTPSVTAIFREYKTELLNELGFTKEITLGTLIGIVFIFLIIGAISNVMMVYAAITCGQLFSNHRILGSVVCYLAIQTALSVLSLLVLGVSGYFTNWMFVGPQESVSSADFAGIMTQSFIYSTVMMLATTALLYIGTYLLMKKKTNL